MSDQPVPPNPAVPPEQPVYEPQTDDVKYRIAGTTPTAKVIAASLTALIVPALLGLLAHYFPQYRPDGDALTGLVDAVITGLLTLAAGYFTRPRPQDTVIPDRPS